MRKTFSFAVLTLALLAGTPALAAEHGHGHAATTVRAMPADQVLRAGGLVATMHVAAPAKASFTCPMHPEVAAAKDGKCPKCKMDLEPQTHEITVAIADANGKPVAGAKVHLALADAEGMGQELDLVPGAKGYTGAFALSAGKHNVKVRVTRGKAKAVELSTSLAVK